MGRDDWYRLTTWSDEDQKQFFARLKRSRGAYHKAQYLRIQALHLQQSGLYADAIALLNLLLTEFASEESQLTQTYLQKAECLWAVGDPVAAFDAYTGALAAKRRYPNSISNVALSFAERFADYDNGIYRGVVLKELAREIERHGATFPVERAKYAGLMASLLRGLGEDEEASKWEAAARDAQRKIALDAIPVARVSEIQVNGNGTEPTATKSGKSALAKDLDAIQRQLRPLLKDHGFRERGRSFNRITSDGLTQVLTIWMTNFDPPGAKHIPGFTSHYYGKFTIDIGVFVPEVNRWTKSAPVRDFIQEPECCMRRRLGTLEMHYTDVWWDIRTDAAFVDELRGRIEQTAFAFFDRAESRDAILQQCAETQYARDCFETPPRIVCAIILLERGEREAARTLLEDHIAKSADHPGHVEYVRGLMERMGLN